MRFAKLGLLLLAFASPALGAPDEERLGKSKGYPVGNASNWYYDESVRVGSFTHQAEIPGIYRGGVHTLQPATKPMPLPRAATAPDYRWKIDGSGDLGVDDYLARQRIMGLLIVKDGVIQVERYQYDRKPSDRFNSQSMAKSIVALGIGIALREGLIASLDDIAERYAPKLRGTLYGATSLRHLLRMSSGAKYDQRYEWAGDTARFNAAISRDGVEAAAHVITERETEDGRRFNYSSAQSAVLGAVLRGATGMSVSDYLTPRLWQAIGAEQSALWRTDRTGLEVTLGNFNATLRDYARLGTVLAYDGMRPDDQTRSEIVPRDFLLEATDWKRGPEAFRPGNASPYFGYGYQFWLFPGQHRRFALLGVYGQSIFVDPGLRLVIVQTAANATAEADKTTLHRERVAFWRGIVRHYRNW